MTKEHALKIMEKWNDGIVPRGGFRAVAEARLKLGLTYRARKQKR